jgi:hypothetical protein
MSKKVISTVGNSFGHAVDVALKAANANLKKGETPKTLADLGWDVQAKALEAFTAYRPGEGRQGSGGASTGGDPVAKLVAYLASAAVKDMITRKGLKVMDFHKAKDADGVSRFKILTDKYVAAHPELEDQAKAQLANIPADEDLFDEEVQAQAA